MKKSPENKSTLKKVESITFITYCGLFSILIVLSIVWYFVPGRDEQKACAYRRDSGVLVDENNNRFIPKGATLGWEDATLLIPVMQKNHDEKK